MAAMRARPRPKRAKLEDAPTYRRGPRKTLSRESWITAALRLLEKSGIGSVKIDLLARQLRVTRGSFYFHFSGLGDLQEALLKEWRRRNCLPFEALGAESGLNGLALFERTVGIWVDEGAVSAASGPCGPRLVAQRAKAGPRGRRRRRSPGRGCLNGLFAQSDIPHEEKASSARVSPISIKSDIMHCLSRKMMPTAGVTSRSMVVCCWGHWALSLHRLRHCPPRSPA